MAARAARRGQRNVSPRRDNSATRKTPVSENGESVDDNPRKTPVTRAVVGRILARVASLGARLLPEAGPADVRTLLTTNSGHGGSGPAEHHRQTHCSN